MEEWGKISSALCWLQLYLSTKCCHPADPGVTQRCLGVILAQHWWCSTEWSKPASHSPGRANPELGEVQTGQLEWLLTSCERRKSVIGIKAGTSVPGEPCSHRKRHPCLDWLQSLCGAGRLQLCWRAGHMGSKVARIGRSGNYRKE